MGRLIIDGNDVYEIDEECVRKRRIPKGCQVYEKLKNEFEKEDQKLKKYENKKL